MTYKGESTAAVLQCRDKILNRKFGVSRFNTGHYCRDLKSPTDFVRVLSDLPVHSN